MMRSNDALHRTLIEVGNAGERLSQIRGSLLGLQRIVPFVSEPQREWIPNDVRSRLKVAQGDLLSLTDYETHLSDKVQFLRCKRGLLRAGNLRQLPPSEWPWLF